MNKFQQRGDNRRAEIRPSNDEGVLMMQNNQLPNGRIGNSSAAGMGLCTFCTKVSNVICQRCGDFYCSPDCQRRDWLNHRYICFPMPALVKAPTIPTHAGYNQNEFLESSGQPLPVLTAAAFANTNTGFQQQVLEKILRLSPQQTQQQHPPQLQQLQQQISKQQNNKVTASTSKNNSFQNNNNQVDKKSRTPTNSISDFQYYSNTKVRKNVKPETSPLPKANSRVLLTGFRTPNRCYVRSLTNEEDDGYLMVVKRVDSYGKSAPPMTNLPKPNTYAIAQMDGIMYRVQVLAARHANSIRVLFIDCGTTAVRQMQELREISDEILALRQHAVMVQLSNVDNYAINDKLMSFLAKFEDIEFKIRYAKEGAARGDHAELFNSQTDKSLNEEITKFGVNMGVYNGENTIPASAAATNDERKEAEVEKSAPVVKHETPLKAAATVAVCNNSPQQRSAEKVAKNSPTSSIISHGPPRQIRKPVMKPPFDTRTLKQNSVNVEAIVLDNSCLAYGYVGCIAKSDVQTLAKVQKYLNEFEDTNQPYTPKVDEYCIAKFEDEWYRAKVIEISEDDAQFTVVYIDFTNESTLGCKDIRRYPSDLTGDCLTNLCLIDGLPPSPNAEPLSAKLVEFLKTKIVLQDTFTIDKVNGFEEQIVIIECQDIIKEIKKQGLF